MRQRHGEPAVPHLHPAPTPSARRLAIRDDGERTLRDGLRREGGAIGVLPAHADEHGARTTFRESYSTAVTGRSARWSAPGVMAGMDREAARIERADEFAKRHCGDDNGGGIDDAVEPQPADRAGLEWSAGSGILVDDHAVAGQSRNQAETRKPLNRVTGAQPSHVRHSRRAGDHITVATRARDPWSASSSEPVPRPTR